MKEPHLDSASQKRAKVYETKGKSETAEIVDLSRNCY